MKTFKILLLAATIFASYALQAQVAIATDGSSPDASAMLEVKTTDAGFLPPCMTEAQMKAIESPAEGLIVYCTDCSPKAPYYYDGYNFVSFTTSLPSGMSMSSTDVYNPVTGKVWMDRNLGAAQVATSSTDYLAYGSLYQWGRGSDGHEIIVWTNATSGTAQAGTTTTQSTGNVPENSNFIIEHEDWRTTSDNLWQGVSGTNNPCPSGYRLPTEAEWDAERLSWSSNGIAGAFDSPLKLPVAGRRDYGTGSLESTGSSGSYWSSTVADASSSSQRLYFNGGTTAEMSSSKHANGRSVRCIKD